MSSACVCVCFFSTSHTYLKKAQHEIPTVDARIRLAFIDIYSTVVTGETIVALASVVIENIITYS